MQIHFSDTLTAADVKRHIPHRFDVPPTCTQLSICLRFEPARVGEVRNMLTLTLFDPAGFRGAGHRGGYEHVVEIRSDFATPGYMAGPILPGPWSVQIDTHMILPGEACRYELSIVVEQSDTGPDTASTTPAAAQFETVANSKPGWYRGDLHAHTIHSDASWDVPDLVAAAKAQALDFVALTDHNTVSPLPEMASNAGNGFLTLGGQELTTFWGHAVCLGAHQWLDWRLTRDGDGMAAIANSLYANEQIYIVAHPKDVGDPYCTGCRWVYPGMLPGAARFVEVWNGSWMGDHELNRNKNVDGLALWYGWLNEGHRIVATAGSDVHGPKGYAGNPGFNTVYAQNLSEREILRGLSRGHLYLSSGPALRFTAHDDNGSGAIMGDTLVLGDAPGEVALGATWTQVPFGATVRLIADGAVVEAFLIDETGSHQWRVDAQQVDWYLIEVRAADGQMLALTNPIFFAV